MIMRRWYIFVSWCEYYDILQYSHRKAKWMFIVTSNKQWMTRPQPTIPLRDVIMHLIIMWVLWCFCIIMLELRVRLSWACDWYMNACVHLLYLCDAFLRLYYICVFVSASVFMYVCICVRRYACMCVRWWVFVWMYVCLHVCMCYERIHVRIHTLTFVYLHSSVCVCMYLYVCV